MYVRVHIDADDVLDELDDEVLERELNRRRERRGLHSRDLKIPAGEAVQALDDAAQALRRAGQIALAFKLDEVRQDYIAPQIKPVTHYRWKQQSARAN